MLIGQLQVAADGDCEHLLSYRCDDLRIVHCAVDYAIMHVKNDPCASITANTALRQPPRKERSRLTCTNSMWLKGFAYVGWLMEVTTQSTSRVENRYGRASR